ncbi:hypothetical protein Tco_0791905 [Tanacetum coccineum]
MDLVIPLGQKNNLAKYMTLSGADDHPPMLDKDLYDSWKSRMELYMQNREHGRMILESVENGPLIWPTVEENGVTRTKKYAELSVAEKIQADGRTNSLSQEGNGFSTAVASSRYEDLDTDCAECVYDISNAQAVLTANISNYGSEVLLEVPHSETNLNNMENQSAIAMQDFEQSPVVDFTDNEIYSDSNTIPYSQYLQETQQANV